MKWYVAFLGWIVCQFVFFCPAMAVVRTGYVSIMSADLATTNQNGPWWMNDRQLATTTLATSQPFYATVHLPHGATIVKAALYFDDLSATGYVKATFRRVVLAGGLDYFICQIGSSTNAIDGEHQQVESGTLNIAVDNSQYTYTLMVTLYNGAENEIYKSFFNGFVVEYEYEAGGAVVIPMN